MRCSIPMFLAALVAAAFLPSSGDACVVSGYVWCDANQSGDIDAGDTPLSGVTVYLERTGGSEPIHAATTDGSGYYAFEVYSPLGAPYVLTLGSGLPADALIIVPWAEEYSFGLQLAQSFDWLIASDTCLKSGCWLTCGGAKFSPITRTYLAENDGAHGPLHSFGGNVYPGCSPDAGQGGQWNHVAHALKLHFLGTAIRVERCGLVDGIPPGSESPETPYNFIEFTGTGTLKGIQGKKVNTTAYFWARAEDHNEPGSSGAKDGALIDRYYIIVYTDPQDPVGSCKILVNEVADPTQVRPVPITDGNMQMHISSCTTP